ncbi:protein FAM3C isoform X2 [Trichomycterus rosablanca]|uniref:protein FAM3C isoform X2 n=1 Tax=Trichomycterus rosablanca TaxID=2290929 RepID=UPI002F3521EC
MKCVQDIDVPAPDCSSPGCCPRQECPANHFPVFVRSGAANMVGPKICFNNQIAMSVGKDNVGIGLNIVLVNGETGEISKSKNFNNNTAELLDFLKTVVKGDLVLLASYEDPAAELTDEIREIFAELGSSVIHSVKYRDSWVFAGATGLEKECLFEKLIVNDQEKNVYGDWPEMVELSGCIPRKI